VQGNGNGSDDMGMGGNGNGSDAMGVGGSGNLKTHSCTPLVPVCKTFYPFLCH